MTDVSVIMPVFNSREYLLDAVVSVLAQDGCDFELILVDDGSTDGSGILCDRIAEADRRVRVIHQGRAGMCRARNRAIDECRGSYVAFCDNDDRYLPGLLADNVAVALDAGADCVRFGRVSAKIDEEGRLYDVSEALPHAPLIVQGKQVFDHYGEVRFGSEGVWNGLYRRDYLMREGIRFDERLRHGCEDILFNNRVLDAMGRVALNPATYYVWMRRIDHSASFSFGDNYYLGVELAMRSEHDLMVGHGVRGRDPGTFARRLMSYVRGGIGTLVTGRSPSPAEQRSLFEAYRRLYCPYAEEILASSPSHADAMALSLLMRRRYGLLLRSVALAATLASLRHRRQGLSVTTRIRMGDGATL